MTKSGRIILALALGGMLGMLVALAVPQIIWWFGPLAGSLIAGFAYALPDIVRHVPSASRTAWRSLTYVPKVARTTGKTVAWIIMAISFSFGLRPKMPTGQRLMAAIIWIALASFMVAFYFCRPFLSLAMPPLLFYELFLGILVSKALLGKSRALQDPKPTPQEKLAVRKRVLFYVTPFGTVFLVGWGVIKIIPPVARVSWDFGRFVVRFAKTLYILVHSKELVLVSIDTALGVAVTYLFFVRQGDPFLGVGPTLVLSGFISVLLGYFLDYQIISRRVLHLRSQKIS